MSGKFFQIDRNVFIARARRDVLTTGITYERTGEHFEQSLFEPFEADKEDFVAVDHAPTTHIRVDSKMIERPNRRHLLPTQICHPSTDPNENDMHNPSPGTISLFATIREKLIKWQKSVIFTIGLTADVRLLHARAG